MQGRFEVGRSLGKSSGAGGGMGTPPLGIGTTLRGPSMSLGLPLGAHRTHLLRLAFIVMPMGGARGQKGSFKRGQSR